MKSLSNLAAVGLALVLGAGVAAAEMDQSGSTYPNQTTTQKHQKHSSGSSMTSGNTSQNTGGDVQFFVGPMAIQQVQQRLSRGGVHLLGEEPLHPVVEGLELRALEAGDGEVGNEVEAEVPEEDLRGVDVFQVQAHLRKRLPDPHCLALPKDPVIDEYAHQLAADGPVHERRVRRAFRN